MKIKGAHVQKYARRLKATPGLNYIEQYVALYRRRPRSYAQNNSHVKDHPSSKNRQVLRLQRASGARYGIRLPWKSWIGSRILFLDWVVEYACLGRIGLGREFYKIMVQTMEDD